jgi:hypothetical protein
VERAAALRNTNIAIKSQISDFDNTGDMLARIRKQKWANLSEKQRISIEKAETELENSETELNDAKKQRFE